MLKESEDVSETILVIEDSDAQRELLTDVLQECGYRVAAVINGEEAIAYLGVPGAIVRKCTVRVAPGTL